MGRAQTLSIRKVGILKKLASCLFIFLTLALPFVYLPSWGSRGWELPKVFLIETAIKLLILLYLLDLIFLKKRIKINKSSYVYLILFYVWLIITSLLGSDINNSLFGSYWRGQGLVFWLHGLLLVFFLKEKFISLDKKSLALLIFISGLSQAIYSINQYINLQFFSYPVVNYAGRIVSTFGQPNFLAGFILLTLPFSLYLFRKEKKYFLKVAFIVALVTQILAIVLTYSRGAILSTVIILWWSLLYKKSKKWFLLPIIAVALVIMVATTFELVSSDLTSRYSLWQKSLKTALQRPITGYGLDTIELSVKEATFQRGEDFWIQKVDRSHNIFLDFLVTTGFVGLGLFFGLVFSVSKKFLKGDLFDLHLFLVLWAFLFYGLVNTTSVTHWFLFFIILGL